MKKIMNLTPHKVSFVNEGKEVLAIEPSGLVARVSTETVVTGCINGIPVTTTKFGDVVGLPEENEDTIYLVSSLVAQRCKERHDVFIPNEPVRDENGVITGCKSLGKV